MSMNPNTVSKKQKAVAYMRYSSQNQSETSIEAQQQVIKNYCDKHKGTAYHLRHGKTLIQNKPAGKNCKDRLKAHKQ